MYNFNNKCNYIIEDYLLNKNPIRGRSENIGMPEYVFVSCSCSNPAMAMGLLGVACILVFADRLDSTG